MIERLQLQIPSQQYMHVSSQPTSFSAAFPSACSAHSETRLSGYWSRTSKFEIQWNQLVPPIKLIGLAGKSDTCESSVQKKWVNFYIKFLPTISVFHIAGTFALRVGQISDSFRQCIWRSLRIILALRRETKNPRGGWHILAVEWLVQKITKPTPNYFSWKVKICKTRQKAAWHSVIIFGVELWNRWETQGFT